MFYFYLALFGGILSTFYAEVVSGSMVNPLSNLFGILLTTPLYILHFSILSFIAFKYKKTSWLSLYLLGVLFGLYEAYITKVLWSPTWDAMINVGGISIFETILLIGFWHPIMAFLIPFKITDTIFISKDGSNDFSRLLLLHIFAAFFAAGNSSSLTEVLSGSMPIFIALTILIFLIKVSWRPFDYKEVPKALKRVMIVLITLLYVGTFFLIRFEELPHIISQVPIWILYFFFAFLFIRNGTNNPTAYEKISYTNLLKYIAVFLTSVFLYYLFKSYFGHLEWLFVVNYLFTIFMGGVLLFYSSYRVLRCDH